MKQVLSKFVQAIQDIFSEMLGVSPVQKRTVLKEEFVPRYDFSVVIGMVGYLKGQVVVSFSDQSLDGIVEKVLGEKKKSVQLITSAVGELVNIMVGKATALICEKDQKIFITPPAIVYGKEVKINILGIPFHSIFFESEIGPFEVGIGLESVES